MNLRRREILSLAAIGTLSLIALPVIRRPSMKQLFDKPKTSERMPVLFIGHGSPMNAIEDNSFTQRLAAIGSELPRPQAILVVSAHWMTRNGTLVAETAKPKTIHDFGGFPKALFDQQYPAPGSPEIAQLIKETATSPEVHGDSGHWGLDHGAWTVLKHMYPNADIPVLQLSLNMSEGPEHHMKVASQLETLRDRGVLILGSGNIVHNLRTIRWEPNAPAFEWAQEFDDWMKKKLIARDFKPVIHDFHKTEAGRLSIPTLDHYLPLFYALGASNTKDDLSFDYEEMQNGSISMRCVRLG